MINQGWSLERALFLPKFSNGILERNTDEPENWHSNAIGLWSGNIPFHLVELVLVSYGCMSKANVTYLNTKFFISFPFQDWNFGIFWN